MVDAKLLKDIVDYNPTTGKLFWKVRSSEVDPRSKQRKLFNTLWTGKEAFTRLNNDGYPSGKLFSKSIRAHRLIWALVHGEWPNGEIDHIDGDRANNKLSNLRLVDKSENQRNASRRVDNSSGVTGVSFSKANNVWVVRINNLGKRIVVGTFKDFDIAVEARQFAEELLGYHPNHGRAA